MQATIETLRQFYDENTKAQKGKGGELLQEIIQKEKGLQFVFNDDVYHFELIQLLDKKNNEMSLIEFLNEYEKYDELEQLLFDENDVDDFQFSTDYMKKRFD